MNMRCNSISFKISVKENNMIRANFPIQEVIVDRMTVTRLENDCNKDWALRKQGEPPY
jgi:hypothetical protein